MLKLSRLPCATCGGLKVISMQGQVHPPCEACQDASGTPTGLMFWELSEECRCQIPGRGETPCTLGCDSGRVLKTGAELLAAGREALGRHGWFKVYKYADWIYRIEADPFHDFRDDTEEEALTQALQALASQQEKGEVEA